MPFYEGPDPDAWITGHWGDDEFDEDECDPWDDPYIDDKIDERREREDG